MTADKGSVRAAAAELGVSPAAVSRGLIELEDSLNTPLLVRQSYGVALTEAGKSLLASSRAILARVEEATQVVQNGRVENQTLSVGATPWILESVLPFAAQRFLALRPKTRLYVTEVIGRDHGALREGSIDLAIGLTPPEDTSAEFREIKLFSYETAVVCRQGHPLEQARSLSDLSDASWALTNDRFPPTLQALLTEALNDPRGPRVHAVRSTLATRAMVENSDMLTVAPWPLVEIATVRQRFRALNLQETIAESVTSALTRRNVASNPLVRQFLECLMAVCDDSFTSTHPTLKRVFTMVEHLNPAGLPIAPLE